MTVLIADISAYNVEGVPDEVRKLISDTIDDLAMDLRRFDPSVSEVYTPEVETDQCTVGRLKVVL